MSRKSTIKGTVPPAIAFGRRVTTPPKVTQAPTLKHQARKSVFNVASSGTPGLKSNKTPHRDTFLPADAESLKTWECKTMATLRKWCLENQFDMAKFPVVKPEKPSGQLLDLQSRGTTLHTILKLLKMLLEHRFPPANANDLLKTAPLHFTVKRSALFWHVRALVAAEMNKFNTAQSFLVRGTEEGAQPPAEITRGYRNILSKHLEHCDKAHPRNAGVTRPEIVLEEEIRFEIVDLNRTTTVSVAENTATENVPASEIASQDATFVLENNTSTPDRLPVNVSELSLTEDTSFTKSILNAMRTPAAVFETSDDDDGSFQSFRKEFDVSEDKENIELPDGVENNPLESQHVLREMQDLQLSSTGVSDDKRASGDRRVTNVTRTPRITQSLRSANVFSSSAIKYKVFSAKPQTPKEPVNCFVTPVRRSTRESIRALPKAFREHGKVVETLEELKPDGTLPPDVTIGTNPNLL